MYLDAYRRSSHHKSEINVLTSTIVLMCLQINSSSKTCEVFQAKKEEKDSHSKVQNTCSFTIIKCNPVIVQATIKFAANLENL